MMNNNQAFAQQIISIIRNGNNPQQLVMSMLQQQSANNPMLNNVLQLARNNDQKGIEEIARNVAKEKGLDFDKEFLNFKHMLGV